MKSDLLIAHNLDIAPRVPGLSAGDSIGFKGIYEWNSQGGVEARRLDVQVVGLGAGGQLVHDKLAPLQL